MKTTVLALLLCTTLLAAAPAPPQNVFSPDQIKFGPVPPGSAAVLEGDPMGLSEGLHHTSENARRRSHRAPLASQARERDRNFWEF